MASRSSNGDSNLNGEIARIRDEKRKWRPPADLAHARRGPVWPRARKPRARALDEAR